MCKKLELHKVKFNGSNEMYYAYSDRKGDYYLLGDLHCGQPLPLSIESVSQIDSVGQWVDGSVFHMIEKVETTGERIKAKDFKRFKLCSLEVLDDCVSYYKGELLLGIHDMVNNEYAYVNQEHININAVLEAVKTANARSSIFPLLIQGISWVQLKVKEV